MPISLVIFFFSSLYTSALTLSCSMSFGYYPMLSASKLTFVAPFSSYGNATESLVSISVIALTKTSQRLSSDFSCSKRWWCYFDLGSIMYPHLSGHCQDCWHQSQFHDVLFEWVNILFLIDNTIEIAPSSSTMLWSVPLKWDLNADTALLMSIKVLNEQIHSCAGSTSISCLRSM